MFSLVTIPLTFVRDYTCPMAESESWNKTRAALLPLTVPTGMAMLTGNLNLFTDDPEEIESVKSTCRTLLILLVPGMIASVLILCRTKKT